MSRARISTSAYQLDADGNQINKRNAWQARSVLYVRLIPPGAADVAHYRVHIPKDAKGPITLHSEVELPQVLALLHAVRIRRPTRARSGSSAAQSRSQQPEISLYRKQHSGQCVGRNQRRDSRSAHRHAGACRDATPARILAHRGNRSSPKQDRERWNDWGIGLLLQGDLKGAEYAFRKVTEAEPDYADGWLNVARALIQEGETDAAKPFVQKSLELNSKLGRTWFFKALTEKADGDYDAALKSLRTALRNVSARPRGAESNGPHPVFEAPIR